MPKPVFMNSQKRIMRFLYRHQRLIVIICIAFALEACMHVYNRRVVRPAVDLDPPFHSSCQEPNINGRRENATILMLARNTELAGAVKSVRSIEEQFNRFFHYPIVFLNDKPWEQTFVDALTKEASGLVVFDTISPEQWGFPEWINEKAAKKSMAKQKANGLLYGGQENYHHMCRFNSGKFYDHPAMQKYKWYWRVEPDVEFTCAITYDPFVAMASTNKRYGYTMALWEKGDTCRSLFRQVADWKKANRLPSTSLWNSMVDPSWAPWPLRKLLQLVLPYRDADGDEWNLCHYWSNFEIADMDFFRSHEYRTLFEHLDSTGGFYFERWGDAPIHSLAAALFLKPSQVHHFADIGYVHENFQICPKNAPGGQLQRNLVLSDHRPWDTEEEGGVGCRCRCNPTKKVIRPFCNDALRRSVEP